MPIEAKKLGLTLRCVACIWLTATSGAASPSIRNATAGSHCRLLSGTDELTLTDSTPFNPRDTALELAKEVADQPIGGFEARRPAGRRRRLRKEGLDRSRRGR